MPTVKTPTALLLLLCILAASCSRTGAPVKSVELREALENFHQICRSELKIEAVVEVLENTLWIYVPIRQNIIETKASGNGISSSRESKSSPALNFLETKYAARRFLIDHDIALREAYPKDYGYSNNYSESFQKLQQGLLSAIHRAFHEVKENQLEIVVFTITDIVNGIESENILHLQDLKKAFSVAQELPQDEFLKRYVSSLRGDKDAVGSLRGEHLTPRPVPLSEFLAKQIENRINFKYQRSNFPPGDETETEILAQAKDTLKAYSFTDYDEIVLTDLRTGMEKRFK
jgi:hypothetical protein